MKTLSSNNSEKVHQSLRSARPLHLVSMASFVHVYCIQRCDFPHCADDATLLCLLRLDTRPILVFLSSHFVRCGLLRDLRHHQLQFLIVVSIVQAIVHQISMFCAYLQFRLWQCQGSPCWPWFTFGSRPQSNIMNGITFTSDEWCLYHVVFGSLSSSIWDLWTYDHVSQKVLRRPDARVILTCNWRVSLLTNTVWQAIS